MSYTTLRHLRFTTCIVTLALLLSAWLGSGSAFAVEPAKWIFSFAVGHNVDQTKVGDPSASQEERNECSAVSKDLCRTFFENETGAGPRELSAVRSVAVSKPSGNLYIGDLNHRIEILGSQGEFLYMFGWNVNKTKVALGSGATQDEKNLCTAVSGNECGEGEAGSGLAGQIADPESVAVDPASGNVYVLDAEYNRIDEYSAGGQFMLMIGGDVNRKGGNLCASTEAQECQAGVEGGGHLAFNKLQHGGYGNLLAVGGPEDRLYVADRERVQELEANGAWVGQMSVPGDALAVAVDGSGDMFVANSSEAGVHEYNAAGALQSCVLDPAGADVRGLALDAFERLGVIEGSGGHVYDTQASKCGTLVTELGTSETGLPTGLSFSLHENSKSEADDSLYVTNQNLQTVKDYRPAIFPEVNTCEPRAVGFTSAELCGEANPNGIFTHGFFKYGVKGGSRPFRTPNALLGEGTKFEPWAAELTDLVPNQEYSYQAWVEAEVEGVERQEPAPEILSFHTTTPPPEVPGAPSASDVTSAFALLTASVNPEHAPARYHFEYGQCAVLAGCAGVASTPDQESSVYGQIAAIQEATGLQPQSTYSYRLVADNEHEEPGHVIQGGETVGVEGHFTTGASPVPVVQTGSASGVGVGGATISGLVDPDGQPAVYAFELGVYEGSGTHYGVVFSGPAGTGTTLIAESLPLSGLQPGTTYAYRVVIRSGYGEAVGETMTFTTEGLPSVLAVPAPLTQLAVPSIAFPGEAPQGAAAAKKATVKCKRGKKLTRGKCVASKRKKQAKKAKRASRAGRVEQ